MTAANGLGDLMRDPDEAEARLDEWAAGFQRKAERYQAAQERTEDLRLSATNSDGSVKVTVRADGSVTDLDLSGRARSMELDELSSQILNTMRRAQSRIAESVSEVMTEEVGEEDPETRSMLIDNLRQRFPQVDDEEEDADTGGSGDALVVEGEPEEESPAPPAPPSPQRPAAGGRRRPPAPEDDEDEEDEIRPW